MPDPVISARGRVGIYSRYGDSPNLTAAKAELNAALQARRRAQATEKIVLCIERLATGSLPLNDEQCERITALLKTGES